MSVNLKLKSTLDRLNVSMLKCSNLSGVRYQTVFDMCKGKTHLIRLDTLDKLLAGLQKATDEPLTVADILEWNHEEEDA